MPDEQEAQHPTIATLLARIDERTIRLVSDIAEMRKDTVTRQELQDKIRPIQLITYGLVALLLTGVVGALLAQVFR